MKIQLAHVAARDGGGVSVKVRLSDGEHREVRRLVLTDADWRRIAASIEESMAASVVDGDSEDAFSSLTGCLLTPEQFDELECAGEFCAALHKGAELLSYGANSRRSLELKLRRYGYDSELCSRVGEELCRRGLIREASDASSIVRVCLRSGYGRSRIIAKLRQKGYGDEAIREALDGVDESVYTENCAALIKKKFGYIPSDADGRRKMAASLARYGYSFSQIKAAMLAVKDDE